MKPPVPSWRLRGRPFDPRQRKASRGEQQARAVDAFIYGGAGVAAGVLVLLTIVGAVWR